LVSQLSEVLQVIRHDPLARARGIVSLFALPALLFLAVSSQALAKPVAREMYDTFTIQPPRTPSVQESTIKHATFFTDVESAAFDSVLGGWNGGWSVKDFRQGQPNAWHLTTGTQSCVGNAWWCGVTGLTYGDGYDNNWVQQLKTVAPINLAGSSGNTLTFKQRLRCEEGYDWGWVLMHDAQSGTTWDTLAAFTGDLGASCVNASVTIPNNWTTRPQPVQLMFLFGSDLDVSKSDSNDVFTGWTVDDVKITASGGVVKFFDDMESGGANWVASSPDPGTLWHTEAYPGTQYPSTCSFLSTRMWVPFQGNGFGAVPDFADAMLISPTINIGGAHTAANSQLRLQFDNWLNLPRKYGVYWSLYIQGSQDGGTTWTPWRNALDPLVFFGDTPQCVEGSTIQFDPYFTARTGVAFGTELIRLGFRIRDTKQTTIRDDEGQLEWLGTNTEGIYFDNIGLYFIYTITGVEPVSNVPLSARPKVEKVFPNPFNPSTTIEFSIPTAGRSAVRIFDLKGRRVATLVDENLGAGVYRVRWNGLTDAGGAVASGVYFASVESQKHRDAARIMVVK